MRVLPVVSAAVIAPVLVVVCAAGCTEPVVSAEVLPPRTSIACDAPTVDDAALGTGLMDAKATDDVHGGYVADLRMSVPGVNVRVDGINLKITRDGKEIATQDDVPTGDVNLVGTKDDVRRAVVENVVLVSRDIAKKLASDTSITDLDFATLVVQITPRVVDSGIAAVPSSFGLNVCNGCLVTAPPAATCAQAVATPVCRPGQDAKSFTCAAPATAGGGNP